MRCGPNLTVGGKWRKATAKSAPTFLGNLSRLAQQVSRLNSLESMHRHRKDSQIGLNIPTHQKHVHWHQQHHLHHLHHRREGCLHACLSGMLHQPCPTQVAGSRQLTVEHTLQQTTNSPFRSFCITSWQEKRKPPSMHFAMRN